MSGKHLSDKDLARENLIEELVNFNFSSNNLHVAKKSGKHYRDNPKVDNKGTRCKAKRDLMAILLIVAIAGSSTLVLNDYLKNKEDNRTYITSEAQVGYYNKYDLNEHYYDLYGDDKVVVDYMMTMDSPLDNGSNYFYNYNSEKEHDDEIVMHNIDYVKEHGMNIVKNYANCSGISEDFWVTMLSFFVNGDNLDVNNRRVINSNWQNYETTATVYDFAEGAKKKLMPGTMNSLWALYSQCLKDNDYDLNKSLIDFLGSKEKADEFLYRCLKVNGDAKAVRMDIPYYVTADEVSGKKISYYVLNGIDNYLEYYNNIFNSYDNDIDNLDVSRGITR